MNDGVKLLKAHKTINGIYYSKILTKIKKFSLNEPYKDTSSESIYYSAPGILDYALLNEKYIGILNLDN